MRAADFYSHLKEICGASTAVMKYQADRRYEELRRVRRSCHVVAESEIRLVTGEEMFERVASR
jgi:hypothetical protein